MTPLIQSATCSPRFSTRPRPERPNHADRVERLALLLGLELMPWQRLVAEVATEYDPATGVPCYREVFVTTPRQSGKTTLILLLLLDRCLSWSTPQACVWTGQTGADIRRKWMQEIVPQLERSELAPLIKNVRRAMGAEQLLWQTDSRIELLSNSESTGHGMVIDFAVLDEVFSDTDNRREAALVPAMATRRHAQMLTCSTAGTGASTVYNRKVRAGRNMVAEDADSGMAYFEWSAPEDWDESDEASWWAFMPALGHTITVDVVRQAMVTFADEPGEFARAYGNRPMLDGGDVFPDVVWQRVVDPAAEPDIGALIVAADITPQRDAGAVAVCDSSGVAELIKYDGNVHWIVGQCQELSDKYRAPVVFDGRGPVGSLAGMTDLRRAAPMKSGDVIDACAGFYDAVADGSVTVRQDDAIDRAVRGVVKKTIGDAYVWSRRASSKDVTPLYAVTLAYAGAKGSTVKPYSGPMVAVR